MARSFYIGSHHFRLRRREEAATVAFPDVCKVRRFSRVDEAIQFLRGTLLFSNGERVRILPYLRRLLRAGGTLNVEQVRDDEVIRRTAHALVAGRLVIEQLTRIPLRARGPATTRPPEAVPPPEETPVAATEEKLKWIRFRVVDDETEEQLANVKLTLTLSDGSQQKTSTNAEGIAYIKGIPDGTCDIVEIEYDEPLEVRSVA